MKVAIPFVLARYFPLILAGVVLMSIGCESLSSSSGASGSTTACPDCVSVADIIEDYEANAMRAQQDYVGKRYNFNGRVESIEDSGMVPMPGNPKVPKVHVKSGGKPITFWFEFGTDTAWVLEHGKGDTIVANCRIRSLEPFGVLMEQGTPSLEDCTEQK